MATGEEREATLSDKSKHRKFNDIFFLQKQSNMFCDVVLKVCNREIYAHSNILAAASPYFEHFLSLDLPRLFSQRSPQVIEIQIDGNEPNVFYEEAVDRVIDFIYTGNLTVKGCNVTQIYEISKIMDMANIISFCEDFIQGKVLHDTIYQPSEGSQFKNVSSNTEITSVKYGSMLDFWSTVSRSPRAEKDAALLSKIKARKVTSVAVQTVPISAVTESKEDSYNGQKESGFVPLAMNTYFPRKRGRAKKSDISYTDIEGPSSKKKKNTVKESNESAANHQEMAGTPIGRIITTRSGRRVFQRFYVGSDDADANKTENVEKKDQSQNSEPTKPVKVETIETIESGAVSKCASQCTQDTKVYANEATIDILHAGAKSYVELLGGTDGISPKSDTDKDAILFADSATDRVQNANSIAIEQIEDDSPVMETTDEETEVGNESIDTTSSIQLDRIDQEEQDNLESDLINVPELFEQLEHSNKKAEHKTVVKKFRVVAPKCYNCPECDFTTVSVREMSAHSMEHKVDKDQCYYCDITIENRIELMEHIQTHTGAKPYHCRQCGATFKTRTAMNLHIPKHSDDKPYICEICSMGFKWKHALTSHLTVHSNRKEHLCDICGYSTAWKAQLKAHKLIHQGKTFKCPRPGCKFETTKKQNLQFHDVTHTGEKRSICDICGQLFSLKRNMRRHMLLHYGANKHRCKECEFSSTRYDKLKEHLFKQHGVGTPPERRLRIADIRVPPITIEPKGQFISAPEQDEPIQQVWDNDAPPDPNIIFTTDSVAGHHVTTVRHNDDTSTEEATFQTVTQTGDVIAVIKDNDSDTYTILNNILNGSAPKDLIIDGDGTEQEQISDLPEFTTQQVKNTDVDTVEQLVTNHEEQFTNNSNMTNSTITGVATTTTVEPATYQIINQSNLHLEPTATFGEQTIQVIDSNNKMQLIKVSLPTRMNLQDNISFSESPLHLIQPSSQTLITQEAVTSQIDAAMIDSQFERIVIEPFATQPLATDNTTDTVLTLDEQNSIVASQQTANQVLTINYAQCK